MPAPSPSPAVPRVNHPLADRPGYRWLATSAVMFGMMGSVMSIYFMGFVLGPAVGSDHSTLANNPFHWREYDFMRDKGAAR